MDKHTKKYSTIAFFSIIIFGLIIIISIHYANRSDKLLDEEPVYIMTTINDFTIGYKRRVFMHYQFDVEGKIYKNSKKQTSDYLWVRIGDSCKIVYAKSNPKISRCIEIYQKPLKIDIPPQQDSVGVKLYFNH